MRVLGGQIQIWLLVIFTCAIGSGCSNDSQEVAITIEDFRFTPTYVHLISDQPIRLVLRNQGRELHRFTSPVLLDVNTRIEKQPMGVIVDSQDGLAIPAGKRAELALFLKSGTYAFRCPVRGHRGMQGVFVVEEAGRE